jgi:hypothetical protein
MHNCGPVVTCTVCSGPSNGPKHLDRDLCIQTLADRLGRIEIGTRAKVQALELERLNLPPAPLSLTHFKNAKRRL